jgi:hypothetical protein
MLSPTPTPQIRLSFRVISPEEYDHAALQTPGHCPHVIFGDLRSGQQLINAACAESFAGMEQLSHSSRGRAQLEKTILHMQDVVQAAEAVSPPIPLSYARMLGQQ